MENLIDLLKFKLERRRSQLEHAINNKLWHRCIELEAQINELEGLWPEALQIKED